MTLISAPETPGMAEKVSLMAASTKHCWPVPVSLMLLWLEIPTFSSMSLSRRSSWILTPSSSLEKVCLLWECAKNVHWLWITASKWIYAACILISILFCHTLFLLYCLFLWFVTNISHIYQMNEKQTKIKSNQNKPSQSRTQT